MLSQKERYRNRRADCCHQPTDDFRINLPGRARADVSGNDRGHQHQRGLRPPDFPGDDEEHGGKAVRRRAH